MRVVTIELLNDKALALLRQLEQLNLLRLISPGKKEKSTSHRQWAGTLSRDTANKMLNSLTQSRDE